MTVLKNITTVYKDDNHVLPFFTKTFKIDGSDGGDLFLYKPENPNNIVK